MKFLRPPLWRINNIYHVTVDSPIQGITLSVKQLDIYCSVSFTYVLQCIRLNGYMISIQASNSFLSMTFHSNNAAKYSDIDLLPLVR